MQLVMATNYCITNSSLDTEIMTDAGTIKPIEGNHHVISAPGNPGGDSFCFVSSEPPVVFSLSCKHQLSPRGKTDYELEYVKATGDREDFFIEYSTGSYSSFTADDLPHDRCGLVYEENFQSYFGPYAGRAFFLKNLSPPNINTASRSLLRLVDGVGPGLIQHILDERKRSPISDEGDAIQRIPGLGRKKAKLFQYQN